MTPEGRFDADRLDAVRFVDRCGGGALEEAGAHRVVRDPGELEA